ncbi:hypothetical protein [Aminobacter sp. MET-1]|uniref:hypothetical protein n=1 Tax=Aminobacter sp. MET-1 TaxID=2951085 RepID=UPI00226A0288|nr:hypothetical protein [Aminobacter sp. MET-1]MCX8572985.1 hypothetical protein [Aminobacter sp. MET-1]
MPLLHQRGVDLLIQVMDAKDHIDSLSREEIRKLLVEVSDVLMHLLERDIPAPPPQTGRTG